MGNITLEERGLITFFDLEQFGYYRMRKAQVIDPYDIDGSDILTRLNSWLIGKKFQNTVPWGAGNAFHKLYCQSYCLNADNDDFIIVLVKSVGAENGGVKGFKIDASVDMDSNGTVASADGLNAKDVAWGQVMYYWFIPSEGKVASIRFPDSVCDINSLSKYVREWVKCRSDKYVGEVSTREFVHPQTKKAIKVERMLYECPVEKDASGKKSESFSFNFRFKTKQFRKKTGVADFNVMSKKITHLVFRHTVTVAANDRRGYSKLVDKYLKAFGFAAPTVDDETKQLGKTKEYEVIVNETPSTGELEDIFAMYNDEFDELYSWDNVGVKLNGRCNETVWLNDYVVKSELYMPTKTVGEDVYSANQIMQTIISNRDAFLAGVRDSEVEDSVDETLALNA